MGRHTRRRLLAAAGSAAVGSGLIGVVGAAQTGDGTDGSAGDGAGGSAEADRGASVRFVDAWPEAPAVDVVVDGEPLIEGLEYADFSRFRALDPGRRRIELRSPSSGETLLRRVARFGPGRHTAVVAAGRGEARGPVWLTRFTDRPAEIGERQALVRLVHASPDAPAVDVTTAAGGRLLFDDLGYGESQVAAVRAGERTFNLRPATQFNIGPVVRSVEVAIEAGRRYAVFAAGYVTPRDEPTDAPVEAFWASDPIEEPA